jgi:hypothetical protein
MIQWKPVLGFESFYKVSSEGQVVSLERLHPKTKRLMGGGLVKPILGSRGYYVVNLTAVGMRKQMFLHKIVLEAFCGLRPDAYEACHNDGNPLNCKLENLRWDTKSNNHKDKKKHGTWQVGEKANNVKLTNKIVLDIRNRKLTESQAVKEYGLSLTNAKRIVNYKTWPHL